MKRLPGYLPVGAGCWLQAVCFCTCWQSLPRGQLSRCWWHLPFQAWLRFSSASGRGNPIGWILFSFGLGVPFSILANSYGARILPGLAPILDALFLTGLLLLATGALAAFAQIARDEVNLETLTTELLHVVETTIQPEQVSLWLKPTE